jgi:hypothetical protein
MLANCGFAATNHAGLQHLRLIADERQRSPKNGPSEVNHLVSAGYQSWTMVQETAASLTCLEKTVAVGSSYSNSLSIYCPNASFKTIFWPLNYERNKLFKKIVKNLFHCMELLHTLYVQ